ncbi:MAG TPA: hypothetical protein VHS31_20190 [Tepidisphaeraceae bacterium]|nr:hypothetical protein [Tepidisphaeraceae bacterium]
MPAVIQCPSCQKEYRWKPELAGKKVKCKCGEEFGVPANEPAVEANDLYDLADEPAKPSAGASEFQSAPMASPVALADGRHFQCPYCNETIEATSTLCVFCGSPLQPAVQASLIQSTPPTGLRTVKMRKETREEQVGKIKLVIWGVVAVAVVIAALFGLKHFSPKSAAQDPNLKPGDAAILAKIEDQNGKEAKDWLNSNDSHSVMGLSKKQALFKVDQFYQMGAKKVVAFGAGISMTLALELPDDAAKRKAIFDWAAKWNNENNWKGDKDEGQKWLEIQMHV